MTHSTLDTNLLDAMIFEAHLREGRDISLRRTTKHSFETVDVRSLRQRFKTQIMVPGEFRALLQEAAQQGDCT